MSEYTLHDWFGYDVPYAERYRMIRRAGFDGVMMWWGDDLPRDKRALPSLARAAGLTVDNVHAPYDNCNSLWHSGPDGDAYTDALCGCADDCAALGIPVMVVHLSSGFEPPAPGGIGLARLTRLTEYAGARGVRVALENLRHTAPLRFALDNLPHDCVGFCYDAGHEHCRTPGENLLNDYGSWLFAVHLHDNDGMVNRDGPDDQHRLPFDGTADWPRIAAQLAASGYAGPVSLEVVNRGYETTAPEDFLRLAFERAQRIAAMLGR